VVSKKRDHQKKRCNNNLRNRSRDSTNPFLWVG